MVAAANEGTSASSTPNVRQASVPKRFVHRALGLSLRLGLRQRRGANNECVDASRSCDDIRDCAAGEICEDNQCQPQGASCTADRDCAARSAATVAANAGTAPATATATVPWVEPETDNASPRAAVTSACGTGLSCGADLRKRRCVRKGARKTETATSVRLAKRACVDVGGGACRTHAQCTAPQSVSSAPVKPAGPVNRSSVAAAAGQ